MVPVVLGIVAAVLHNAPVGPASLGVPRRIPDALAPNDILEIESAAVLHDPLGNGLAFVGFDLRGENTSVTRCENEVIWEDLLRERSS